MDGKPALDLWGLEIEVSYCSSNQPSTQGNLRRHEQSGKCPNVKIQKHSNQDESCSFSHNPASAAAPGNGCEAHREKGRSSTPAPWSKSETPAKSSGNRGESPSDKRSRIPCRYRKCTHPSWSYWHPPVCQNYTSETGCICGNKCFFSTCWARCQRKGGAKGSVALMKESFQLGCVSQDSYQRKSIPCERRKFGSNRTVKFSNDTWHQINIREKKGPSRGIIQKCEPHERSPWAPGVEERSQEETLHQERCARGLAWD